LPTCAHSLTRLLNFPKLAPVGKSTLEGITTMKKLLAAAALSLSLAGPAFADESAEIWKAKCKSCHGEDGRGDTKVGKKEKVADMSTPEYQSKHSDAVLKKVIAEGSQDNKKMKPFKDKLSDAEMDGLVKHIRGLKK
jgi:cytochrome c553